MQLSLSAFRKRCMDLISIESQQEMDFLGKNMARAGVREIWTSGRLCDKEVSVLKRQSSFVRQQKIIKVTVKHNPFKRKLITEYFSLICIHN